MPYSLTAIGGKPTENGLKRAQTFGFVCELARSSQFHSQIPTGSMIGMLDSAVQLSQIRVYFNNYGECMGYVIWALLSQDVEQRLLRGTDLSLDSTEWNEGSSLWIVDFFVRRGSLPYVLLDMRDNLFANQETLTYFRVKNGKRVSKRLSRSDGGNFFRKTPSQTTTA